MNGAQKKVTNADGSSANFEYNADGTLSQLTNRTSNGTIIDDYTYTYDAAKNQISKTEILNGQNKGTTSYTYDSVNRLKSVTEPSDKLTQYTYDKAGNRNTETVVENSVTSTTTYSYNDQERLMKTIQVVGGTTKTVSYNYDYNGNVYSKTQGISSTDSGEEAETAMNLLGIDDTTDCAEIYEYDVFNQLVKTYKGSNVITNVYNGEGHRVSKTSNGVTTNYLYEYARVILETDGNNNQTARNIYGTNLISRESNNTKYTYHYNGHGDVTSLTDQTGTVAAEYDYDPFGNMIGETGAVDNPFRYSGYEFGAETNLYYLKSRFYNSETARFMQEDTYRGDPSDPLSLNLYTYCANNPIGYVDRTGHSPDNDLLNSLMNDPEALKRYVANRGGINRNMPANIYQILYDTWDAPPAGKPTGPENRYSNYEFGVIDALNWLIQTGGNINFVLQMRDIQNLIDSAGNFDSWLAKDMSAKWQINMISTFSTAVGMLNGLNDTNYMVNTPNFFLGGVEGHPETLLNTDGRLGIYDQVLSKVDSSIIAGAYYGEDFINQSMATQVSEFMHEQRGKSLLWIPYYHLNEDNGTDDYFDRVSNIANMTHGCVGGNRPLFDIILLQPGTFYFDGLSSEGIKSLVEKINGWNNSGKSPIMGFQFEFDMGLVTGRDDPGYSIRNHEKKSRLKNYLTAIKQLNSGSPMGIYSGGPNEHGYANPQMNAYKHNTGNHRVQDSWENFNYMNGMPYNKFPDAYSGNLIYDINNYLFGRGMSNKLSDFLK